MEGMGKYYYENKNYYVGEFLKGERSGEGSLRK
jgi:hypothetical protein